MSLNLDDALQTFIVESRELLQQMEEALLQAEHCRDDGERINAIFRAAHTIKGSAGLFGFDHVVAFTHGAESVLDRLRNHEVVFDDALVVLLLEVCDHLGILIALLAEKATPDAATADRSAILERRLAAYLAPPAAAVAPGAPPPAAADAGAVAADQWHISLRFGPDVLRHGMDPLAVLRYLGTLGTIVNLVTLADDVPHLVELDPESCHLGFELGFASTADKATIDGAFDFVRDDCQVRILPPHSSIEEYRRLIDALPGDPLRLGEMLLRCGTLTAAERQSALAEQAADRGEQQRPIGEVLIAQKVVQPPVVAAALDKQQELREARTGEPSLIRVDAAKLDQLINLVGELIIAGAGANLVAHRHKVPDLVEATAVLSRLVEDVRDSALNLRMVQIGATFNRFRRVVRDVARELGKDISLEVRGAETELDKTVVEKIGDPLTHIVRNAMDHGIEAAEVRRARGKPAQGQLCLNAFHESGSIVIEVSDDGGGLAKERILRKAVERGLVAEGQALSDKEIFNLVFEPGFSTAEQVSNLSGRGVGMDVVKRNIHALRGTVDLESVEGEGTLVRIRLPLTLAIIDGFLVEVGNAAYVVPLDMVVECIELPPATEGERAPNYLNLRGAVLPFIRLRDLFASPGGPPRRENVVVVQYAGQRAGLVVDRLAGEFQTVIKPLGKVFSRVRGIGGSTILGSGEVALILDVPGLVRQVAGGPNPATSPNPINPAPAVPALA